MPAVYSKMLKLEGPSSDLSTLCYGRKGVKKPADYTVVLQSEYKKTIDSLPELCDRKILEVQIAKSIALAKVYCYLNELLSAENQQPDDETPNGVVERSEEPFKNGLPGQTAITFLESVFQSFDRRINPRDPDPVKNSVWGEMLNSDELQNVRLIAGQMKK